MIALSASARKRRYDDPDTKGECGESVRGDDDTINTVDSIDPVLPSQPTSTPPRS